MLAGRAVCLNRSDREERRECNAELREEANDSRQLCREQRVARRERCGEIGEAAYDPDTDPELLQDPSNPSAANPYFPLDVGNRWVFEGDGERIVPLIECNVDPRCAMRPLP